MNAASKLTRYAWIVAALCWVVALLNYLDRLMLTSMRLSIVADIEMSESQFGRLHVPFVGLCMCGLLLFIHPRKE